MVKSLVNLKQHFDSIIYFISKLIIYMNNTIFHFSFKNIQIYIVKTNISL